MKAVQSEIDFVLLWVDGDDPAWKREKESCRKALNIDEAGSDANAGCRYKGDSELLRYWFRGVEQFAPWVRRIHFVTCGQKPAWLVENHPKLNLVNHRDFIPGHYLPSFNSRSIEWNCHRIQGLSEHFVLFNDDVFLLQPIGPDFFFRDSNPVLIANLRYPGDIGYNNWSRVMFNDYALLVQSFDLRRSIWQHRNKWFSVSELGWKRVRQNLVCFVANKTIPVHMYGHFAHPLLKSVQEEIWKTHPQVLDQTCSCKFRSDIQVNQYLVCAWLQAEGRFYPAHERNLGRHCSIRPDYLEEIEEDILTRRAPQICVNDSENNVEPERSYETLLQAFQTILPGKSAFEKN